MRMVAQVARPSLKHTQHAQLPANKARIGSQLLKCASGGAEKQRIELALVAIGDLAQLGGEREGDQKIGQGQQKLVLLLEPALRITLPTQRAMPVATGVIAVAHRAAIRTRIHL